MFLSHHHQFIFIHIHRTGGTTLVNLLRHEIGNKIHCISQHGNALSEEVELLQKYPNYQVFSFVRNPWDRLLSWYALFHKWNPQNMETERKKIERFLENDDAIAVADGSFHYNQLDYLISHHRSIDDIKLFRFETFDASAKSLFEVLELPLFEIPILNNTTKKRYQDFFTKNSKALVAEKCEKDIAYFGYSF
jgi:hypothetical protein